MNCAHTWGSAANHTGSLLTTLRIGFFASNPRLTLEILWIVFQCISQILHLPLLLLD